MASPSKPTELPTSDPTPVVHTELPVGDPPTESADDARLRGPTDPDHIHIVAVIPVFNESGQILQVLRSLPPLLHTVIVVDDASTDGSDELVAQAADNDLRILLVRHEQNQGVGGAMVTGFKKALQLGAEIVVKIDGDGQMSPDDLPALLKPLLRREADYTKGNRFRDLQALRQMPPIRRMGNVLLSFLTKAAVGYWDCFDPCNGFIVIRAEVLRQIPLHAIRKSYFFETSMLMQLYLLGAVVQDVPTAARYGSETSHLSIRQVLWEFPPRLVSCFLRRILLKNFLYDFTMASVFLLTGLPMLLGGVLYGGVNWIHYGLLGISAPTGTVVIPAMLIILGFQLLLSTISEDLRSVPRHPLCRDRLNQRPEDPTGDGPSTEKSPGSSSLRP